MPDDEAAEERTEAQRLLSEARIARAVRPILTEERYTWWDRIGVSVRSEAGIEALRCSMHALHDAGYDVSTKEGVERLRFTLAVPELIGLKLKTDADIERTKRAVAWMYRSEERSATLAKRALAWFTGALAAIATASEIVSRAPEWLKWFRQPS